jgi:hypothetical protein
MRIGFALPRAASSEIAKTIRSVAQPCRLRAFAIAVGNGRPDPVPEAQMNTRARRQQQNKLWFILQDLDHSLMANFRHDRSVAPGCDIPSIGGTRKVCVINGGPASFGWQNAWTGGHGHNQT